MSAPHLLVGNIFFAPYTYGGATIVAEEVARHLALDHGWQVSAVSAISRTDLPAYALRKVQTGPVPNYLINLPPGRGLRGALQQSAGDRDGQPPPAQPGSGPAATCIACRSWVAG